MNMHMQKIDNFLDLIKIWFCTEKSNDLLFLSSDVCHVFLNFFVTLHMDPKSTMLNRRVHKPRPNINAYVR